ncbi:MAG: dTDP-4-dehydrorhamnose reductase [Litoreibacter sp.]|nr:dTDP-4-dehydrorhamnose reductase [Litoreibacter sp.]
MTILVFGKTGQVATELGMRQGTQCLGRQEADLTNPEACAELILSERPSAVINAAAYTAVDKAEEEEALATVINGDAPTAMAKACAELDIPFTHISTDYVFAGTGVAPHRPDDPTAPPNAYGRSKLKGEQGVALAGGRYAILRTSWVFSSHGANFLKTMMRLGAERDALNIVADQIGGPTPASAIAAATVSISDQLTRENAGIYHFAGAPDTSWAGFAEAIFEAANQSVQVTGIPTADYPTPAARPLNSQLDCTKTREIFAIEQPDWRVSVAQIVAQLKAGT